MEHVKDVRRYIFAATNTKISSTYEYEVTGDNGTRD